MGNSDQKWLIYCKVFSFLMEIKDFKSNYICFKDWQPQHYHLKPNIFFYHQEMFWLKCPPPTSSTKCPGHFC